MLDEEKIRYMTQLVILEERVGKKIFPVSRYFKKDYIGGQMFRSFFGYTFYYFLFLLVWILYKLDELFNEISIDGVLDTAGKWDVTCTTGPVLYPIVTWIVYSRRYDYMARSQTMYASELGHLARRYEKERPEGKRDDRGGRVR